MARRDPTSDQLDRLAELRRSTLDDSAIAEVRALLAARSPNVVAKAAAVAAEARSADLLPAMRDAFEHRLTDPIKRDPGCVAKLAIARALSELEDESEATFLAGIRHVQREPVWGGTADTAAELRGACAIGLLGTRYRHTSLELVRLLADPETPARVLATRAIGGSSMPGAEEVLRYKIHMGDAEVEVLIEAIAGLLGRAPENTLALADELLAGDDPVRAEAAALALGDSRLDEAFEPLERAWRRAAEQGRPEPATVLLALSTLRREPAFVLLEEVVAEASPTRAAEALRALALHRGDDSIAERARASIEARGDDDRQLEADYRRYFQNR